MYQINIYDPIYILCTRFIVLGLEKMTLKDVSGNSSPNGKEPLIHYFDLTSWCSGCIALKYIIFCSVCTSSFRNYIFKIILEEFLKEYVEFSNF